MNDSRSDRWMALAGPAFLVLFIVALGMQGDGVEESADGKAVVKYFVDHHDRVYPSVFLAIPLVGLLLLFTGALRTAFGSLGGSAKRLFQYGAVLYAAGLLFGATLTLSLDSAASHELEEAAQTLNLLASSSWIPVIGGAAAMMLGAGLAVLSTRALPAWLGWIAAATGVVSFLGPGGFVGFLVTPLWVAIAGVLLFLRRSATPDAVEVSSAG